jgi:hypothetical protein
MNVGIGEVAKKNAKKIDIKGKPIFEISKRDGTMRNLLDVTQIKAHECNPQLK